MKFRVSLKDFVIFIFFSIFLLYLCAIGVLNFTTFGTTGEFYGLAPFEAFTGAYLPVTLILFFGVLIFIFMSVSSYIFSKEKGKLGLNFGEKELKGYSRWAKPEEIKNDKDVEKIRIDETNTEAAGAPLCYSKNEIWVDNGEYHSLVIGATGSGKSECIVKPLVNILAKKGESMIIMDPKGELYKYGADYLKKQGYNIKVLNFRDPLMGNAWNPLTLPYQYYKEHNYDKANELLNDVALNILYDPSNKDAGGFWEKGASDYFCGIAYSLFMNAREEEININSINYMATVGEEKFGLTNYMKEYMAFMGEQSIPYTFASTTMNAPNETKGGLLATFRQKIRLFASREDLSEMLSYTDFDLKDLGKQKTVVFIIIHDEKTTYHALATIFIKQCYETLVDEAQKLGGKLSIRTNFILDEFANMPPLKDVDAMVTAARSRAIRFTFIIQNFGQLKDIYGEKSGTIKGNCGNLYYLLSTEMSSLEEISKLAGEVKSSEKEKTSSTPLVTTTDLQKLKLFDAIIFRWRKPPFKTSLTPDFKMTWGVGQRTKAMLVPRSVRDIKLFNIKEFVKDEKMKRNLEALEQNKELMPELPNFNSFKPAENVSNMGMNMNSFTLPPKQSLPNMNFDIDKMIKDIDLKIAELDKEEAERKKREEVPKEEIKPEAVDQRVTEEVKIKNKIEEDIKKEEEKPNINVDADSIIINDSIISDDQFFDDFFGD